jgi:hypothetical protein
VEDRWVKGEEEWKGMGKYSVIPNDGIEILGGDGKTVYFALKKCTPGFIVPAFTDVAHMVDWFYA